MQISFISSIHRIEAQQWNALWPADHPFVRHEFLAALEDSGSTGSQTGWQPHHMLVKAGGRLLAAAPLFIKSHSYGEYVFDWAWADAYQQHGLAYYPKLVNAIPFTPATGPRLGLAKHLDRSACIATVGAMQEAIAHEAGIHHYSGWHSLFPAAADQEKLSTLPLVPRFGFQYHWFNPGFRDFTDFLESFTSRKRKQLNKERRRVADAGLRLQCRRGDEVSEAEWQQFYALYQRTYLKRSGSYGYLGPSFFSTLAGTMPRNLLLVTAHQGDCEQMVAGAFFLRDNTTLYGRYWGAVDEYDGLHFEACYYQGIEYAIQQGLWRFDPGAQGEHKIQRGFTPIRTCSYHWLADTRFAQAIAHYCEQEALLVQSNILHARDALPFRQDTPLAPSDALLGRIHPTDVIA